MSDNGGTAAPLLAARDLARTHGRTRALTGASADLYAGEILAVTAPAAAESPPCCTAWPGSSAPTPGR